MTTIDPRTEVGAVHLIVSDVARLVSFYTAAIGLTLHRREGPTAALGDGERDLLVLTESPEARRSHGTTGLYHFAILVPSRTDLARSLARLVRHEAVLQGAADHGVSEALYLADPDGNGIEMYRDRARAEWPRVGGRLAMSSDPLDMNGLMGEVSSDSGDGHGVPPGTRVGHVHLHVANLADTGRFYADVLGFDLVQRFGPGALFLSAGGYHHHVGVNTWAGVGAPPPPPGALGLRHVEIRLPDRSSLEATVARVEAAKLPVQRLDTGVLVHDPSRHALLLVT